MVHDHDRRSGAQIADAAHQDLRVAEIDIVGRRAAGKRRRARRVRRSATRRMLEQHCQFGTRGLQRIARHLFDPRAGRIERLGAKQAVARTHAQADWHLRLPQGAQPVVPECRGVADLVVVARFEQLDHAAMQELELGQIGVGALLQSLFVPRPEHVLVAIAEPQPQQMLTGEGGFDRHEVLVQPRPLLGRREDRIAIGERERATRRVSRAELDGDLRAGVATVGGDLFDAQRIERGGQPVGEILGFGLRLRQQIGQAEARRVERDRREARGEHRLRLAQYLGGARRGMQHGQHRTFARAGVVHAAIADGDEMASDAGRHRSSFVSENPASSSLPQSAAQGAARRGSAVRAGRARA